MKTAARMIVCSAAIAITAGCVANDPYMRTKSGAGIGAVVGAVLGHQLDDDSGRYVGAAVGALAGGAVGNYMDRQQVELNNALERERAQGLEIRRLSDGSIKLDIPSEVSFDFDSASVKPGFGRPLGSVANILNQYNQTVVHIVGHTDSNGSEAYNMQLSQRRADSVANFLNGRGIQRNRLITSGRGESQPRATNATGAGRQMNRRVEMIIRPIVEGQQQRAYQTY